MQRKSSLQEPITYAKMEIGGIVARPDSRHVMEKAVLGHPVEVTSGNDYINLYHVFERMQAADKKRLGRLQLIRRQIGHSQWRLFVVENESEIPDIKLNDGYDPKRGRYKRYADQLAAGEAVIVGSKAEAIKARRAWQLYVPSAVRKHLKSTVRKASKSGQHVVAIVERRTRR